MERQQVKVAIDVHKALSRHAAETGGSMVGYASIAIAEWLKGRGVEIDYPAKSKVETAA